MPSSCTRASNRYVAIRSGFRSSGGASSKTITTDVHSPRSSQTNKQAQLNIELHADLRPEFTWNTKQLYVAVTAEYATDTSPRNVVTLWNRIVESAEDAKLDIRRLPRMYPFIFAAEMNAASGLLGLDYNVTLSWNVMPKVGRLYTRSETVTGLRIPAYYIEPTTTTTKTS